MKKLKLVAIAALASLLMECGLTAPAFAHSDVMATWAS
jgi:hypothetical protein